MKYLGIDFGLKRIGLAVSEGELASPWQILEVKSFSDAVGKVFQIIIGGNFQEIIVGLPEGRMGRNVLGFVKALRSRGVRTETYDEMLSSKKALQTMIDQGIGQKKRRFNDDYSAAEILQNYLDNQKSVIASD